MGSNVGRWFKYAKAKFDDAMSSANADMDDLEAEQAARAKDRPWLDAGGDTPTIDEVRARIDAESVRQGLTLDGRGGDAPGEAPSAASGPQQRDGEAGSDQLEAASASTEAGSSDGPGHAPDDGEPESKGPVGDPLPAGPTEANATGASGTTGSSGATASDPQESLRSSAEKAQLAQAAVELEARQRQADERLEQIRRELGIDGGT